MGVFKIFLMYIPAISMTYSFELMVFRLIMEFIAI